MRERETKNWTMTWRLVMISREKCQNSERKETMTPCLSFLSNFLAVDNFIQPKDHLVKMEDKLAYL